MGVRQIRVEFNRLQQRGLGVFIVAARTQHKAQHKVPIAALSGQLQPLFSRCQRLFVSVAALVVQQRQGPVRFGKARRFFECVLKGSYGLALAVLFGEGNPEVVVGIRVVGRDRDQFGQHVNGAARAVLLQVEPPQGQEHFRVCRILLVGALVECKGLGRGRLFEDVAFRSTTADPS